MATQDNPFLSASQVLPQTWPSFLPTLPQDSTLDSIWIRSPKFDTGAANLGMRTEMLVEKDLPLGLPGVDALSLIIGALPGGSIVSIQIQMRPEVALHVSNLPLTLRFSDALLKPVRKSGGGGANAWEADPARKHVDIALGTVGLDLNADGDIALTGAKQIDLAPVMIGATGVVIEARNVGLFLDSQTPPPGQPAGWRGVHIRAASLYLPGELGELLGQLSVTDAYIGNGGFTGKVASTWTPPRAAKLFGLEFTLESVSISFVQNALVASSILGTVTLPFFDAPLGVEIAVNLNGSYTVRLRAKDGLGELTKPGILTFRLDSLGFTVDDGRFVATMSGMLKPLLGGLDWPEFEVRELAIDSDGNVHIDGGWLTLRQQYALEFYGFTFEITRIGFGSENDGGRWVGFTGGLKLVDGLKAGASVKGLRVGWHPGGGAAISFDGVGVEFEVPGTLRFKGEVAYRQLNVSGEDVHRFDGAIKLELLSLGLEIDSLLVLGSANGPDGSYNFLGIYLGLELPAGIPLWSTGLALYGLAGLYAMNMEPDKHPDESWYGMGPGEGWYKRPQIGVTDINNKWVNRKGSLALGAGVTIGTLPDNGFTFNGRLLLALVFPGPIIMIEGKANVLKDRASLGEDALFRCLVVLDCRAGTFTAGIDASYKVDGSGALIDIGASAEIFFSLSDPTAWHLYLGMRDPRERRIRARTLIYEADAYFMLDAKSLALGARAGYDAHWRFGPLAVGFEAWIEGNVQVNWKPIHFHGDLWAHGKAELSVFGFGLGLSIDARIAADVFDPFHLLGEFSVGISLPWPLPDFDVSITLEWGPEPNWPAAPLPLQEVAVEHFKVTTSWPLPRAQNLLAPNYDDGAGFRVDWTSTPAFNTSAAPPAQAPVVPLDCRPHITFSRAVHDLALVGTNVSVVTPAEERIGDPDKNEGPVRARYELLEVALDAWTTGGSSWHTVARKAAASLPPNAAGVEKLFGSWAPTPPMPDGGGSNKGQTKLWLWSKNPYDYVRHGGREWGDWAGRRFRDDPCIDVPQQSEQCWTFEHLPDSPIHTTPATFGLVQLHLFSHPDEPQLIFAWVEPAEPTPNVITLGNQPVRAICLAHSTDRVERLGSLNVLLVRVPPGPNRGVRVACQDAGGVSGHAVDAHGKSHTATGGTPASPVIEFAVDDVTFVVLFWSSRMCFWSVCVLHGASEGEIADAKTIMAHNIAELERWKNIGVVLKPHTSYRLAVRTKITGTPDASELGAARVAEQVEYAFFRTEGPPGLAGLAIPANTAKAEDVALRDLAGGFIHVDGTPAPGPVALASALNDLAPYVRQTIPRTVPAHGDDRPLPRPVYRGYDVSVAFNEDYVSQMYRMDGRDLALYLYDSNNRPVRDAQGRVIVIGTKWDVAPAVLLDEYDRTWVTTVQNSSCASLDETTIPHDEGLHSAGLVLAPDLVHEARVTPLLLHESFPEELYPLSATAAGSGARLGRWVVEDLGTEGGPSSWQIAAVGVPSMRVVVQGSNIYGGPDDPLIPAKPGTMLVLANRVELPAGHPDQPSEWTDYRVSVQLRSADNDGIGVAFRHHGSDSYRFSMDRERRYRRLVRTLGGITSVLAEDDFIYRTDQDYRITIEALGADIAVYQDGERVFTVRDTGIDRGTIGLYCWASQGAQFADIRVDDFRATARPVYRFQFTTSRYANFLHQVHGFQDETWKQTLAAAAVTSARAAAVVPAGPPDDAQARAWSALEADATWGPVLSTRAERTEVTRIETGGATRALLVRCAEPFDWQRCTFALSRAAAPPAPVAIPLAMKLHSVTRHASDPNAESVGLIVRDAMNPTGLQIQQRRMPGPLLAPSAESTLFVDEFDGSGGTLFEEMFGPNALDLYQILSEGDVSPPAAWSVTAGSIRQTSNIYGSPFTAANLAKRGTLALTGSPEWTNVRVLAQVISGDDDSIGIAFRYVDNNNFYRFEMNRQFGYRRLVKCTAGTFTELWSDTTQYVLYRPYRLEIVAFGPRLYGFVDRELIFHVADSDQARGRIGLYCWANQDSRFSNLRVEAVDADPLLWSPAFADLTEFRVVDAIAAAGGPSAWHVDGTGGVLQTAAIAVPGAPPAKLATFLLGGAVWSDVRVHLRMQSSDPNTMGVMFRVAADDTYYRFSMSRAESYRRLVKVVGGIVTVLWQDSVPSGLGEPQRVAVIAVGPKIEVWLNGSLLLGITDDSISEGSVALYTYANGGVRFSDLRVFDAARRIGRWTVLDQGQVSAPSSWRMGQGRLLQTSNIWGGSATAADADKRGTLAIAGDPMWRDYRLVVECAADDDDAIGVVFRYRDPSNYYLFSLDAERSYRRLVKVSAGVHTVLWQAALGYVVGNPLRLTVDAIGSILCGYVDTTRVFAIADASHQQGRIGLYCWANDHARFDRVEVSEPPLDSAALFRDDFQALSPSVWTLVDKGTESGPSSWSASGGELLQTSNLYSLPITGAEPEKEGTYLVAGDVSWGDLVIEVDLQANDDDALGVMFRYKDDASYYRFSMDSERGYRRLVSKESGVFRVLWEDSVRYQVGRRYRVTILAVGDVLRGFLDGVPMFMVSDLMHATGKFGLYCWAMAGARFRRARVFPAARIFEDFVIDENFAVLRTFRWTFVDEGDTDAPSAWDVVDGRLVQASTISDSDTTRALGTLAIAGQAEWVDYRFTAALRPAATGAIGIVFRRQDATHYYRFSLNSSTGARELVRRAGNKFTTLWSDAGSGPPDETCLVTMDCVGTRVVIYINGEQCLALNDSDGPPNGGIGLYSYASADNQYLEVRVALPRWTPYFRFGREPQLADGTRLRIFSGKAAGSSLVSPLELQRFATAPFDDADVQFRDVNASVDLRVVGARGPEHTRRFLPDVSYAPVTCRALSKADGTAFLLFPAADTFASGSYRLALNYRRDISATAPDASLLSEQGVAGVESTVIDIPLPP